MNFFLNSFSDWAQKCLEECQWNLELATAKFFEAKKEGKIPQEAYAFTTSF